MAYTLSSPWRSSRRAFPTILISSAQICISTASSIMVPSLPGPSICGGLGGAVIVGVASSSSACANSPASLSPDLRMYPTMALRLSENWAACSAFPSLKTSFFISRFFEVYALFNTVDAVSPPRPAQPPRPYLPWNPRPDIDLGSMVSATLVPALL
jgi:hypothetical protein